MEFLFETIKSYGVPGILGVLISAVLLWFIADRIAKPGTEVSVLWGLVKYVKRGGDPIPRPPIASEPIPIGSKDTVIKEKDMTAVGAIKSEVNDLIKVSGSTPCGLWLAAEAAGTPLDSLLQTANQIKPEHQPEALAHLSQALTVFNRAKEARKVAEESFSAATDVHNSLSSYTYVEIARKYLDANLLPYAQQAAKLAVDKATASKRIENYHSLMQIYARAYSSEQALSVARAIQDPKAKSEAYQAIIAQSTQTGNKDTANIIREALPVSQQIPKAGDRAHAFAGIARAWMLLGNYSEAARIATQAEKEAELIDPKELFGEVMRKSITNDMKLLEASPLDVLRSAEAQGNPRLLTYFARFLPERAPETIQIARSAFSMAVRNRMPDTLAEVAELFDTVGLRGEAEQAAQKTIELAMNATDRKLRDTPLKKAAEILAQAGNYETALSAAASISTPKDGAEAVLKVLLKSYVRTGKANRKAVEIVQRLQNACSTLNDKDRSTALMQLAASMAFLDKEHEAYQAARLAPLSGHRLSAYAIIIMISQIQTLPTAEATKIYTTHSKEFEAVLAPIFNWGLAT